MKNLTSEFCIMPDNPPYFRNFRFEGSERHEIFEGRTGNRKKSIDDGLVIFTTPEIHRTGKNAIHKKPKDWLWLKKLGEITWCKHYNKTQDDFLIRYGRNYI